VAGTGRRTTGLEDHISGLSEGQRYALALVLNLVFVGIVIGAFALLYTSGRNVGRHDVAPTAMASVPEPPASAPETANASGNASANAPGDASGELDEEGERALARIMESYNDEPDPASGAAPEPASESEADGSYELAMLENEATDAEPMRADVAPEAASAAPDAERATPTTLESASSTAALDDAGSEDEMDDEEAAAVVAAAAESAARAAESDAGASDASSGAASALQAASETDAAGAAGTRVAANVAPSGGSSAPMPRPRIDPAASLWVAAGQLAASLQSDFPCSQFVIQAGSEGRPALRARVGASEDLDAVRDRIDTDFGGEADIAPGLGCTAVIGGGYVALADGRGQFVTFDDTQLSGDVLAALPRESTCATIGAVLATQPALVQQLARDGSRPATWVRSGGQPAICEETDSGSWAVLTGFDVVGRHAPAIVLGGDVAATEAREAGSVAVASAAPSGTAQDSGIDGTLEGQMLALNSLSDAADPAFDPTAPPIGPDGEVAPISGPSPQLPPGVASTPEGFAVTIAFTVQPDGAATDLSVTGAGMAPVTVVGAALDLISVSRFPARASPYQGRHTVRFPSTEFMDMLSRLSVTSTTTGAGSAGSPVWDRQPTKKDSDGAYPRRALERGVSGDVTLGCTIAHDGRIACEVMKESPSGWGFGRAAMSLSAIMRAAPRMSDGVLSEGQYVTVDFVFAPGS
jgi:TonB family protein